ncbi:hypothetical protein [Neokomagataea anthophila]|uniref:Cytochrome b561 bacterial/Ni-hydrogenase domain-containing protein n=1 Tax=Neokomagataea anthophila TaxID=2826925 RepID=A0ABS5E7L8_9PROT|nr:hypothetical protein [Neokomagataea anthophila]MBR0559866.1 hypothetical protein [Neokomagataea anthophila]
MGLPFDVDFDKPQDANVITLKWLVILHLALIAFIVLIHIALVHMQSSF